MQRGLKDRHDDSRSTKDQGALDFEYYYSIPSGISSWQPKKSKEGEVHYFDIVPFPVGPDYPFIKTEGGEWVQLPEGDWAYILDVWIHRNVGPDNAQVVCPKTSYKKSCPICEHMTDLLTDEDDKERRKKIFSEKAPKRRSMYNVIVRDGGKEEEKGNQVFEISHWFMEKNLQELAEKTRTHGPIYYADPDEGNLIRFKMIDKGDNNLEVTGYSFEKRDTAITDEDLEKVVTLDALLKQTDYDTLYKLYWGEEVEAKADSDKDEPTSDPDDNPDHVDDREESIPAEDKVVENECPHEGLEFGEDHQGYDVCDACENEPNCLQKKEELKKAETPPKKPKPKPRPRKLEKR